jgi:hypothetical protein
MGRTNLIDPELAEELTRAQYRSAHHFAAALPDATDV